MTALSTYGQSSRWSFTLYGGAPFNLPLPLSIRQMDHPTLRLSARYRSEPFRSPYYWVWRIARWNNNCAWEFEAVHHKLFLENPPDEVQWFAISHGYNILLINRAFRKSILGIQRMVLRFGLGWVLSHPETEVRSLVLSGDGGLANTGYYLTGPVLNMALAKRYYLSKSFFLSGEIKCNPSVSNIPIRQGSATLYNIHVALVFGIGMDLRAASEATDN